MRKWLIVCGLIALLSLFLTGVLSASGNPRLYVVNSLSGDITSIDLQTEAVIDAIPLGMRGYGIAVYGSSAYVTATPTQPGKGKPALLLIDLQTGKVTDTIPMSLSPLATVHVRPGGRQAVVVTAAGQGARNDQRGMAIQVELATKKVTRTVSVGLNPLASAMTPDGKRLFTADWASHTISVVDLQAGRLHDTIPIGLRTVRVLVMRPDGQRLYTLLERLPMTVQSTAPQNSFNALNNANTQANVRQQAQTMNELPLWEIDTTTDTVTKYPFTGISQAMAAAVSPDGERLYLYGRSDAMQAQTPQAENGYALVSYNLREKKVEKTFGDFGYLATILVSADGKKLYLIGTPGDPAQEASVQRSYASRGGGNYAESGQNTAAQVTDTMQDLSRLKKTVTILDAETGTCLKVLTVGSFPRGAAMREK